MNKLRPTSQKGFTLVEAVVATTVFAFVISAILGVYISVIQLDAKARSQRAVSQNARYIMEFLAKEIRNGSLDYSRYPSSNAGATETDLYIVNQAGEQERFSLSGTNLILEKAAGTTNLNSSSVRVSRFRVLAAPSTNPFVVAVTPPVNEQPRVTVLLELESALGSRPQDQSTMTLQSTFTVRNYPARRPY